MRYIDTSSINVPLNWLSLAKSQFGNTYSALWSYFKENFEDIVGKKCWYSESNNMGSVNPIDHFRPKAKMVRKFTNANADLDDALWCQLDCETRNGYPFLEFEFTNYRYACAISNSLNRAINNSKPKGKSNFFPLRIGSPYADSLATINNEIRVLLDPCSQTDTEKLLFNELGEAEPHILFKLDNWSCCQVMVSIELYHLHYYRFIDSRKEKWDYCKNRIELIDKYLERNPKEDCIKEYILDLKKNIKKESEFSAVAIDCIHFYKTNYNWLNKIFTEEQLKK